MVIQNSEDISTDHLSCILVTGGVGFVGSHIVEALLKEGRKVVIYDIFNSETSSSNAKTEILYDLNSFAKDNNANLIVVDGDIRDENLIVEVCKRENVTSCIHVAGLVDDRRSVKYPMEYIEVNIKGTASLHNALGKCGVKHIIQASTRSVFGQVDNNNQMLNENAPRRPINPYGASKVGSDAMAHCYSFLYSMNVTLIRIFATYGPRGRPDMMPQILVERIHHGEIIQKFGDGSATRTWIYISDIVDAFLIALKNPQPGFNEYNTGTLESTTLNDLIATAEQVCEKKANLEFVEVPMGDAHTVGFPDFTKINRVFGWVPKVSLKEGLQKTYAHYKAFLETKNLDDDEFGGSFVDQI